MFIFDIIIVEYSTDHQDSYIKTFPDVYAEFYLVISFSIKTEIKSAKFQI